MKRKRDIDEEKEERQKKRQKKLNVVNLDNEVELFLFQNKNNFKLLLFVLASFNKQNKTIYRGKKR